MRCNNCGKNLSAGTTVCPVCGSAVQGQPSAVKEPDPVPFTNSQPYFSPQPESQAGGQHICSVCGSALPPNAVFCDICGNKQENPAMAVSSFSKYKKYIAIAAILVVVVILVIAILPKDNTDPSIIGTWELVGGYEDGEYVEFDEDERSEWEFINENEMRHDDIDFPYTDIDLPYTIENDILTIFPDDSERESSFKIIKLTRDELVLGDTVDPSFQYLFKKQ